MFDSDSPLVAELKSHGFDIQELQEKEKKTITDYAKEAFAECSEHRPGLSRKTTSQKMVVEGRDAHGHRVGLAPRYTFYGALLFLPLYFLHPAFGAVGVLSAIFSVPLGLTFGLASYQDAWVYGLWRWLTDWSDSESLTDQEVIEHLSRKLKEEKEKALGITIADEKEELEEVKRELKDYRRELLSQRKGNEQHGLEDEIDVYVSAIDEKIAEIDKALERINEFLADVRQLASDIAAEILPVYRRRQKVLDIFDAVPETIGVADEHLESAEKKLEESQLKLERKLKALSESIQKANHISAELGKLKTEDALHSGQLSGVLEASEEDVAEKSSQETADCTRA
jgi:prefoldin subunit 5